MIEIFHTKNTQNSQLAYDRLYQSGGIRLRDSFYLWILSLLQLTKEGKFLDISCGEGRLIHFAYMKGFISIGTDFSLSALRKAKSETPMARWVVADAEKLPFPNNEFHYISNIGSIEHYSNPSVGVSEIARVLHPSGIALILLPNSFSLLGNIKHVAIKGEVFDDGQPIQRYNTLIGWKNFLERNGLKIKNIVKYEMERPRTLKDFTWFIKKPNKILHLFVSLLLPTTLANCFVFICIKSG